MADPRADLERLFVELFDAEGLRRFLRGLPEGEALVAALPTPASAETLALEATLLPELRRGVNAGLFAVLRARFPGRSARIGAVAARYAVHASVGGLPPVWNIAAPPPGFVGREPELAWLDAVEEGPVALTQAVVGLGGVGKSSLARAWAWRQRDRVRVGWWLRAEHRETFEEDLLGLGRALGLIDPLAPIQDRAVALDQVLGWLRSAEGRWLLVLDNAGDPSALSLPLGPGVVLVTSRDRRWERKGRGRPVGVLPPEEARLLLLAGLEGQGSGPAEADAVAAHLGCLPLALAQAHAWCHEHGQTLAACLRRLEKPGSTVLRFPVGTGEATVAQTWTLAVEGLAPEARAILEQVAFLGPDDIPVEALFGEVDEEALDLALGALHRGCLVDRKGDRLDVHRLVQRVTREGLSAERAVQRLEEVQGRVRRAMPDPTDPAGWPLWRRLGVHAETVAGGETEGVAKLLGGYAVYVWTQAQYTEARRLQLRALDITERAHGPNHPETARCLGNLAATWSDLGEHVRARPLEVRALDITEQVLGPDHPHTARCLGNLAETWSALGEHDRAKPLQVRALDITERALGPDHTSTAIRLGNLAATLSAQAEHDRARPLQVRALDITERALGPDHPDTARCLGSLAETWSALGEYGRARPLQERALDITERALGPEHPETARCLGNLAAMWSALGEHAHARPLEERALEVTERALGPEHPTTAIRLGNLAVTCRKQGENERAQALLTRAVQILECRLGSTHPTTAHFARLLEAVSGQHRG